MNELEDRLKTALDTRAADFSTSPDAWERTMARARDGAGGDADLGRGQGRGRFGPGGPGRRGLTRFTPLAAAAAVVVVAVASAALASAGGWRDLVSSRPSTSASTVTPPWYWTLGPVPKSTFYELIPEPQRAAEHRKIWLTGWLRMRPTCGRLTGPVISFDQDNVWFSQATGGYQGLYLCDRYDEGGQAAPADPGAPANIIGWAPAGLSGDAVKSITSVTATVATVAGGQQVAGRVWRGPGLPYGLWAVDYPLADSAVIVFRDAAGQVVTQLSRPVAKPVNPFTHPTPLMPAHIGDCATGDWGSAAVRVPQTMDGYKTWTYVEYGEYAGEGPKLCEYAGIQGRSASFSTSLLAFPTLTVAQPVLALADLLETSTISGVSAPWVKSVTAVLADGRTYRGIFADGSGFPDPVWLVSFPANATATLVFRDAAGRVVATLHGRNGNWPGVY